MGRIDIDNGNIKTGNKTYIEKRYYKVNKRMNFVVDGQAAKIDNCNHSFFCYWTNFKKLGNSVLANSIFEYIMTKNVDGEGIRVLKTVSNIGYQFVPSSESVRLNRNL